MTTWRVESSCSTRRTRRERRGRIWSHRTTARPFAAAAAAGEDDAPPATPPPPAPPPGALALATAASASGDIRLVAREDNEEGDRAAAAGGGGREPKEEEGGEGASGGENISNFFRGGCHVSGEAGRSSPPRGREEEKRKEGEAWPRKWPGNKYHRSSSSSSTRGTSGRGIFVFLAAVARAPSGGLTGEGDISVRDFYFERGGW